MATSNRSQSESVLFISYSRSTVGREIAAMEVIASMTALLEKEQVGGGIHSFDAVHLTPSGGEVNGFILVRGDEQSIEELRMSEELAELMLRGHLYLDHFSVVDGVAGQRHQAWIGRMANMFVRREGMDVIK